MAGMLTSDSSRLYSKSSATLDSLKQFCEQKTAAEDCPLAASIESNIPIYELPPWEKLSQDQQSALQDEWYAVLLHGPGVFAAKNMYCDHALIDRVTSTFHHIIKKEAANGDSQGDHFAGAGKNDRIWNSFSKHGMEDPASFLQYYSNPYLDLVSQAWLGPGYRITAQVNNVKPGTEAQVCHRDYHLGFMSAESCSRYPRAMQVASQCLTLQGAVAHVDVPLESGPTRLLPYSQKLSAGYMSYRRPEFNEYFLNNYVALPLAKGDGLFFNPALFHAAGTNESRDVNRLANLLQISSAFGKPMEAIDALPLVERTWGELKQVYERDGLSDQVKSFISAVAEGYPFPTNLDRNAPGGENMAPDTEQDVLIKALKDGLDVKGVVKALEDYRASSKP